MKDHTGWGIWIGMLLIGLNFIMFGLVYLQEDTFWWYYRYVLGGAMFCIGLSLVIFCIMRLIGHPKVKSSVRRE